MAGGEKSSPVAVAGRVQAGDVEGVEPEMALQVDDPEAVERSQLLDLERLQLRAARLEALDVVELRGHV
jgi:hypothetical protein